MAKDTATIIFHIHQRNLSVDLEVPLGITANDLFFALNAAYDLKVDSSDITNCYLKAESPIVLLKGNRTLAEFGIRNGSVIHFPTDGGAS